MTIGDDDLLPVSPLERLRARSSEKWRSYPPDVLPLTVAEMDFDLAGPVRESLQAALNSSDTGYAMPYPELGTSLAGFAGDRWGWDLDPAQVTAVTDVGVGVVELLRLLIRPGDPVAFSPPVYPPFFEWVPEARGRIVEVPLRLDSDGWRLDLEALEAAFAQHPAVYILCNPHNPVGRVHSLEELTALVRLARIHRVPIISDEIHAPLVLPGATFTPLLTIAGAAEIAVAVQSASKAFNLAGLKCAAIVTGSARMRALVEQMPPDARWRIGHFGVLATVAAYNSGRDWLDRLLHTLDARRALLGRLLHERLPHVSWHPPEATFLAWLDCREIGPDSTARDLFLERGRVALEPGLAFGAAGSGFVRLNYATSEEILDQALQRMDSAVADQGAAHL